ncbi:MAG: AMP-binding protein [Acidimicrobiales bacterium]
MDTAGGQGAEHTLLASFLAGQRDEAAAVTIGRATASDQELIAAMSAVMAMVEGADVVAIEAAPSLEFVALLLGSLAAGCAVVPLPPTARPSERQHIITDCAASLVFSAQETEGPAARWPTWQELRRSGRRSAPRSGSGSLSGGGGGGGSARMGDASLVLYTSGTTGRPKGVSLSTSAMAACLDALSDAWSWAADDVLVHGLPLYHLHGLVLGVLGPLHIGSPLLHTVRAQPADYAAARGSLYFGVPTVWTRIARDQGAATALAHARLLVSGSAALPVSTYERLTRLTGSPPVERYGMTETQITLSVRSDGDRRPGVVGVPLPGIEARVVDEKEAEEGDEGDSATVPGVGTIGELHVRGSFLFDGYLGRPEDTAASYSKDGWFRTGDAAMVGEDGSYRIVGRLATDIIKTNGFRVGAGEVEDALLDHPAVHEAAVVGVPDEEQGQRIVAYVVVDGVSPEEVRVHVQELLARHKAPSEIRTVEALPRNAMGKILKHQLLT